MPSSASTSPASSLPSLRNHVTRTQVPDGCPSRKGADHYRWTMRRFVVNSFGIGMVLVLTGACATSPESAIDAPAGQDGADGVTGGEIIVSGDLAADEGGPQPNPTTASSDPTLPSSSTTVRPTVTTSNMPSTRPPSPTTTRPPADDSNGSAGSPTATSEARVIGDGPVMTDPMRNGNSGESPGADNGLRPVFFALEATTTVKCADTDPGSVRLRWEVIGAETVDISIGFVGDIRQADQPPAGTIDLPLDCQTGSQYFVVAENPDGETVRSVTVGAR